jgi:hypothetical protein
MEFSESGFTPSWLSSVPTFDGESDVTDVVLYLPQLRQCSESGFTPSLLSSVPTFDCVNLTP